ncbi:MAG: endopeptidase La [Oscillospiraceae bacterium]|nr:endopeptidase La [Oscillospiraceae bacterium]
MVKYTEKLTSFTLPVIAMRGMVVFPDMPTGFEATREISVAAIEKALESDKKIFIVTQIDSSVDIPEQKDLYKIGTIAVIKQALKLPDKQYRLIVEGVARAEMTELHKYENGELYADVIKKAIALDDNGGIRGEALIKNAIDRLNTYLKFAPKLSKEATVAINAISDPGLFSDFIAANVLFKYEDKQEILEEFDPIKRAELISLILESEIDILKLEEDINKKVHDRMDKSQRDYFLREQLHVIREELGNTEPEEESDELYDEIVKKKLPKAVEDRLLKENEKLSKMAFGSAEATVIKNYIDACLELPWTKKTKDRLDIKSAEKILNEDHDGLIDVKKRIIEFLAVKQLAPELKTQIICLVGAPGVGKTSICASIARAMKRKYVRISLGGIRDEAEIRGHRKTYIGSMPGRIVNALTQAGSLNPVVVLDEIDKLAYDGHGDPASALLEVLDGEQNHAFRDHFIEIPVDLSDCMFIATANTTETIPRALLDRMEIISIKGYTASEKISIAKNHIIPKQVKRHGLNRRILKFTDASITEIIEYYTREQGVRNLEREIAKICRRAAKKIVSGEAQTLTIESADIINYLEKRKYKKDKIEKLPQIGVVNGLAWTESGGELLKVEVLTMPGTGKLELTGMLGDVMKESAHAAISLIRKNAEAFGIKDTNFYNKTDIHIHFPEGAVPKDGPSAGVSMTCALVSALSEMPVRTDIAMTGEITLTGNVLAIGGLREKCSAAYANGMKKIIIPIENLDDLDEVDEEVKQNVEFIPADSIFDVLRVALCGFKELESASETKVKAPSATDFENTNISISEIRVPVNITGMRS